MFCSGRRGFVIRDLSGMIGTIRELSKLSGRCQIRPRVVGTVWEFLSAWELSKLPMSCLTPHKCAFHQQCLRPQARQKKRELSAAAQKRALWRRAVMLMQHTDPPREPGESDGHLIPGVPGGVRWAFDPRCAGSVRRSLDARGGSLGVSEGSDVREERPARGVSTREGIR